MEDVNLSLDFQNSIDQTLVETYGDLYQSLIESENLDIVKRIPGVKFTLERMISHFSATEEYEKCAFIKKVLEKYPI
jgi:hypothetical protein